MSDSPISILMSSSLIETLKQYDLQVRHPFGMNNNWWQSTLPAPFYTEFPPFKVIGWMPQWLKWLNTKMVIFSRWLACMLHQMNIKMVEMVEYHNGYFLKMVSMYVTSVTPFKGWMSKWLKWLNGTMNTTMVTFSRWLACPAIILYMLIKNLAWLLKIKSIFNKFFKNM